MLSAILSGAFSFALFKSNARPARMVYCPLTKKLQPVNLPPASVFSAAYSLNQICAADSEKTRLALAISENAKLKFTNSDQIDFENLAFDFWQKGKTAFDSTPPMPPSSPEKCAVKNSFSATNFGGDLAFKIVWKTSEKFAFQAQPRPPTTLDFPAYNFETARKLSRISRRLAPRAPPVLL